MAARPIWKGHLRLSLVTCAVSLSPAITERERVSFHLLNPKTGNRVKQQLVDAETDDAVARDAVVKGYEYAKGKYVEVEDEEFDKIKIESTHTIDIERFVARAEVDALYYNRPYFLVPDGRVAMEAYGVIREAIKRADMVALGRVVLAAREHVVAIEPRDKGMTVTTLRAPKEVRSAASAFEDIRDAKAKTDMLEIADAIIKSKAGRFEPKLFEDRYQEALRKLVTAKAKGRRPALPKAAPEPGKVVDLMDALRRSMREAGMKPPAASKSRRRAAAKRRRKAA